ncbi:cell wall hydrolase [Bosea sp. (in: a-proteobacteria)]|uniref:cell wall hydrolase n=1 Tax=Bosea sp. (in: a-proteobacteria) TaxID=1871050 RepID=UPI00273393D4|nr:cell wall hydrolase [Bosea sp. (in: a-proteobacteria)]MDP3410578.1 cell wall hydrolase [Bosea sp. (in: a-proteobacteria)]
MRAKTAADMIAAQAVRSAGSLHRRKAIPLLMVLAAPALGACSLSPVETAATKPTPVAKAPHEKRKQAIELAKADPREKDCLVRAMYFESNRSSDSGLLGVGTVVLNRVESPRYPDTICSVVGAPRQFAPGVLTRSMAPRDLPRVEAAAEAILAGKRNEAVGNAKHFHMAGLRFSYANMHYVTVAGGNAFYVKGERPERRRSEEPTYQLASVSTPLATSASSVPTSFAAAPLAFAPAPSLAAAAPAATLLVTAPLPPGRPMDLGLTRKTASAGPEARDLRFASLMPESRGLRGSLKQD